MFDNPHITVFWKCLQFEQSHHGYKSWKCPFLLPVKVKIPSEVKRKAPLYFWKRKETLSLGHQDNSPYPLRECNFLTFSVTFTFTHESCLTLTQYRHKRKHLLQ